MAHKFSGAHHAPSKSFDVLKWSLIGAGSALAVFVSIRRKNPAPALMAVAGAGLLLAETLKSGDDRFSAKASALVNCKPEQAFGLWRDPQNLSVFNRHIDIVRETGDHIMEWTAAGAFGKQISWRTNFTEQENEQITWHSTPGSLFPNSGRVTFKDGPGARGTLITMHLSYEFPGGALGRAIASAFGRDPSFLVRENLRRFKALVEAGEIPTTEGQSHGPRSSKVAAANAVRAAVNQDDPDIAPAVKQTEPRVRVAAAGGLA